MRERYINLRSNSINNRQLNQVDICGKMMHLDPENKVIRENLLHMLKYVWPNFLSLWQ